MKFFPERTKRILGVELMREIFVDGKIADWVKPGYDCGRVETRSSLLCSR